MLMDKITKISNIKSRITQKQVRNIDRKFSKLNNKKAWQLHHSILNRAADIKKQPQSSLIYTTTLLFIYILQFILSYQDVVVTSLETPVRSTESVQQQFKLDCQPGEQRHFNYESSTRVWGSAKQEVRLRASLRLRCMEAPSNSTLKYLAEVLSVSPSFNGGSPALTSPGGKQQQQQKRPLVAPPEHSLPAKFSTRSIGDWPLGYTTGDNGQLVGEQFYQHQQVQAEPVLEEVAEAATRLKRSVSGWFSKTWGSVKDFFSNIFTSSERSSINRDQALGESGIDIARQCKANKGKDGEGSMPIDDSVFDDLEPKYYIGASLGSGGSSHSTAYEFDQDPDLGDDSEEDLISFFDDPKPPKSHSVDRIKRASGSQSKQQATSKTTRVDNNYDRLLRLPFVFVQSRSGKIIEVRFSQEESDLSIKNFKRHLCDLFATNLDKSRAQTNEVTPIGQHTTKYLLDSSANSNAIKQSLIKAGASGKPLEDQQQSKQLVRVLAIVGTNEATNDGESREPATEGSPGDANTSSVSVLRSINSTNNIQLSSRTISPDIEQIQVRVKQIQQISDGRMTATAGQLGMSLIQTTPNHRSMRVKRDSPDRDTGAHQRQQEQIDDIADLLQVFTSFSVQLVPVSKLGNFAADLTPKLGENDDDELVARMKRNVPGDEQDNKKDKGKIAEQQVDSNNGVNANKKNSTGSSTNAKPRSREPLVIKPPGDSQELQKTMQEWRHLESQLQFSSPSSLLAESNNQDGQLERLEILRNQIQMRLNEEFLRNKLRAQPLTVSVEKGGASSSKPRHDIGLGLTQLILDSGVTAKKKGSIYTTIEEVIELEMALDEDSRDGSISRLLRDTARVDKLKDHCKSAIATLDDIRAQSSRLELKQPFGVDNDDDNFNQAPEKLARIVASLANKNQRRLEQCKQVAQLLLRVSERQATDLVLDLMDECNQRMLAGAKHEELGYGPTSRYYRHLRQQFIELMGNINKPSESLIDRLVNRLHYAKLMTSPSDKAASSGRRVTPVEGQEFTYVTATKDHRITQSPGAAKFNRSLLREEDDYNNNDGAGSLVMVITSLAAKPTIGRAKRLEVMEKLLQTLKSSSCSLFNEPDLDILESMGNFQEPLPEMVGKVVHLAKRCRHHDQYLIACIHGLQGQLQHSTTQRFLAELLRSTNVSCTVKSEILLTLIGAILIDDLKPLSTTSSSPINKATSDGTNEIPPPQLTVTTAASWPASGRNQIDDILLGLIDGEQANAAKAKKQALDKKCLGQLISYYMSKKRPLSNDIPRQVVVDKVTAANNSKQARPQARGRRKRAVINDNHFWDDAQCKRWSLTDSPRPEDLNSSAANVGLHSFANDLVDEIDDNSILIALANNKQTSAAGRSLRRSQKLLERELDSPVAGQNGTISNSVTDANLLLRRRHKCTASKTYGPKNAEATLKAEIVNDLIGSKDENKFLARFRLSTNFLGNRIDVGRMYLWHQKRTTRAHVNILGKSLWDTSHSCRDKAPRHLLYMPLFDFNLWLVKVSVGLRLHSEMGFFSNCDATAGKDDQVSRRARMVEQQNNGNKQPVLTNNDELELFPTITLRASGEASAKFVVARAGMSLASQYGYQGSIRVSRQPESCMSIYSAHQPMNITFSSWFQLWDNDCHYWGSRNKAEPQATKWRLEARKPTVWLDDECLSKPNYSTTTNSASLSSPSIAKSSAQGISP